MRDSLEIAARLWSGVDNFTTLDQNSDDLTMTNQVLQAFQDVDGEQELVVFFLSLMTVLVLDVAKPSDNVSKVDGGEPVFEVTRLRHDLRNDSASCSASSTTPARSNLETSAASRSTVASIGSGTQHHWL